MAQVKALEISKYAALIDRIDATLGNQGKVSSGGFAVTLDRQPARLNGGSMTVHALKDEEVQLLRKELELLMGERAKLLQVVGASAVFVANLDTDALPDDIDTIDAAEVLAERLNELPEETLKEALESVKAEIDHHLAAIKGV